MADCWQALAKLSVFPTYQEQDNAFNLLCASQSNVFVWSDEQKGVHAVNMRLLQSNLEDSDEELNLSTCKCQLLRCSQAPPFLVERVCSNESGDAILLYGGSGVAAMRLHRRKGPCGDYGGGHEEVVCSTYNIDVYSSCVNSVKSAKWLDNKHFLVLSTDSLLRKFSISHVTYPMLSVSLMDSVAPYPRVSGPGQEWVGFSILEGDSLVLLRESGEVYQLFMSETKEVIMSPDALPMYPAAEDNYTAEAAAILVLPSVLPIIVIATPNGEIHHCVMLPTAQSTCRGVSEKCLFVFERLNLASEDVPDFGQVELVPSTSQSYFIKHRIGAHHIVLPWAKAMDSFLQTQEIEFSVSQVQGNAEVEFILCAQSEDKKRSPLCGMAVVSDVCLGDGLICAMSDGTCIVHMLQQPSLGLPSTEESIDNSQSVLEVPQKESSAQFYHKVEVILRHSRTTPVFHVDTAKERSEEDCFKALASSTQHLAEQYILKQEEALSEIKQKSELLLQFKLQQEKGVKDLETDLAEQKRKNETLLVNIKGAESKGQEIALRLRKLLCSLSVQSPELTSEERKFDRKLKEMQRDIQRIKARVQMLKGKCKTVGYDLTSPPSAPTLTDTQVEYTKKILKDQMSSIKNLIVKLNMLKELMSVEQE